MVYYSSQKSDAPNFYGGFDTGVDLPLPTNGLAPIKTDAKSGGWDVPKSTTTTYDSVYVPGKKNKPGTWNVTTTTQTDTAYVTFVGDSVKIKLGYNKAVSTYLSQTKAPNGVIYVEGMDVRLQGTVKGQYTVAGEGDIYLDNDIVYSQDPKTNPNSGDLLGIVAQNNVIITDNNANNSDININASIFCSTGGFGAENYDTRSVSGNINLLGGIIQNTRAAVGTFSGNSVKSGFNKRYMYDNRLMSASPPSFPGTGSYEIVSWLE